MNYNYLKMMRFDHWIKNIFVFPGVILAFLYVETIELKSFLNVGIAFLASCFAASANYLINEWLDREHDKLHPTSRGRPAALGLVNLKGVVIHYAGLAIIGLLLAALAGNSVFVAVLTFLLSGLVYNVKPIRAKDFPYLDVLVESFNNPIRLYIGWLSVIDDSLIPLSLILSYWTFGAFLMTCKRITDYRKFESPNSRMKFRPSLGRYTELSLSVAVLVYACLTTSLYAAFSIKYKFESIFLLPLLITALALYFAGSYKDDSVAANPERIFRSSKFMMLILLFTAAFFVLLKIDLPYLEKIFFDVPLINPS